MLFALKQPSRLISVLIMLLVTGITMTLASHASTESDRKQAQASMDAYHAWLNAPWTDDDRPYATLRAEIDAAVLKTDKPIEFVRSYQKRSISQPSNPKLLFAYCYSIHKALSQANGLSYKDEQFGYPDFFYDLARRKVHIPRTYNCVRLSFLRNAFVKDQGTIKAGKRLLERTPDDAAVKYALAIILVYSDVPANRNLAADYQRSLAQRIPNDPRTYYLLGSIHYRQAWLTHSQAEADLSIAAYKRAYARSPQDAATQREGEMLFQFIEDLKAKWKKNG